MLFAGLVAIAAALAGASLAAEEHPRAAAFCVRRSMIFHEPGETKSALVS